LGGWGLYLQTKSGCNQEGIKRKAKILCVEGGQEKKKWLYKEKSKGKNHQKKYIQQKSDENYA